MGGNRRRLAREILVQLRQPARVIYVVPLRKEGDCQLGLLARIERQGGHILVPPRHAMEE